MIWQSRVLAILAVLAGVAACGPAARQQTYAVVVERIDGPLPSDSETFLDLSCTLRNGTGGLTAQSLVIKLGEPRALVATSISCSTQASQSSNLRMTITREDHSIVGVSETSADYGIISVSGE